MRKVTKAILLTALTGAGLLTWCTSNAFEQCGALTSLGGGGLTECTVNSKSNGYAEVATLLACNGMDYSGIQITPGVGNGGATTLVQYNGSTPISVCNGSTCQNPCPS